MRSLSTYLLIMTLACLAGSLITGWAAWNAQIADTHAQKEYDAKWFSELEGKINQTTDIEQLRGVALHLGSLAKITNHGYVELKDQYQATLSKFPEILVVFTFFVGFAWWKSRKGDSSA